MTSYNSQIQQTLLSLPCSDSLLFKNINIVDTFDFPPPTPTPSGSSSPPTASVTLAPPLLVLCFPTPRSCQSSGSELHSFVRPVQQGVRGEGCAGRPLPPPRACLCGLARRLPVTMYVKRHPHPVRGPGRLPRPLP